MTTGRVTELTRNQKKRQRRSQRRSLIRQSIRPEARDAQKIIETKKKQSRNLQKRAIRAFWTHGLKRANAAAIADKELMKDVGSSGEKDSILSQDASFERLRVRQLHDNCFKRVRFALKLLTQADMYDESKADVRLFTETDVKRVLFQKVIIK